MYDLKLSTSSQEVILGPFLDDTDGKTAETALTVANTDIKIFKAGSTASTNKNSGGATHAANGYYHATLDATDTNTVGSGVITVNVSGALPVRLYFRVLSANQYDALFGADLLQVDAREINGSALAASRHASAAGTMVFGTISDSVFSPTSTQFECTDITEATADHYIGRRILFLTGSLANQATSITDYALAGSNGRFTVEATASGESPANGNTILIV